LEDIGRKLRLESELFDKAYIMFTNPYLIRNSHTHDLMFLFIYPRETVLERTVDHLTSQVSQLVLSTHFHVSMGSNATA